MNKKPQYENYIFSGTGYALGKYRIDNSVIESAIKTGYLTGFDAERVLQSDDYKQFATHNSHVSPFEYMAGELMGFKCRYHVVPFPPVTSRYKTAETSLDLCVRATESALNNAGIHPEQIGAWLVSTATPHEQAPGLAETLKAHFTQYSNKTQCMTLTSACVGFNYNLERAVLFLKNHSHIQHVVLAHSEVMSELLVNESDFVPFVTFGDSAAAVVLSRSFSDSPEGIRNIINAEDLRMIDFLGANRKGDLYMNARMVKRRAVPNIAAVFTSLCDKMQRLPGDIDWFIPHQTGNAIVHGVAEACNVSRERFFQEVQYNLGNLSGASVPVSIALLMQTERLKPKQILLAAVAGLGGEYGGFSYIVPENIPASEPILSLSEKRVLVTGGSGSLGAAIALQMALQGAHVIVHYNSNGERISQLQREMQACAGRLRFLKADFAKPEEVDTMIETLRSENRRIDYLIHTAAISGKVERLGNISEIEMQSAYNINYRMPVYINEKLFDLVSETILFTGSVAEDAQFSGSAPYVASKKALRSYAVDFSTRAYNNGVRCIYYMPGIIGAGMGDLLNEAQKKAAMNQIGQHDLIDVNDIALRMTKAVYLPRVMCTRSSIENHLRVIKDGYYNF